MVISVLKREREREREDSSSRIGEFVLFHLLEEKTVYSFFKSPNKWRAREESEIN